MIQVSDQTYTSVGSGAMSPFGSEVVGRSSSASYSGGEVATYTGWKSLQSSGTGSFTRIHDEVSTNVVTSEDILYCNAPARRAKGRPNPEDEGFVPPVGSEMPTGDMLLPMLAMALVYVVMNIVRKTKKIQMR